MPESYDEAALRHYNDAEHLAKSQRFDNAGHLVGFAAECAIKYAFEVIEQEASPRLHLPELVNVVLKRIHGRSCRQSPLRDLLVKTRYGFFHTWRVNARYYNDGYVDSKTYQSWKDLAMRSIGAAKLTINNPTSRG
jgi:hypothetical protein